jgi:hypothetical protein
MLKPLPMSEAESGASWVRDHWEWIVGGLATLGAGFRFSRRRDRGSDEIVQAIDKLRDTLSAESRETRKALHLRFDAAAERLDALSRAVEDMRREDAVREGRFIERIAQR